jgi:hypothetical protein
MCISLISPCIAAPETASEDSPMTEMPDLELLLFLAEAIEMDGQLLDAIEMLDLDDNNSQPSGTAASAATPGSEDKP